MDIDALPKEVFCKLPLELWFKIRRMVNKELIKERLDFPTLICSRLNHPLLADCWKYYLNDNRWWTVEGGEHNTVIAHHVFHKKMFVEWTGIVFICNLDEGGGFKFNELREAFLGSHDGEHGLVEWIIQV